MFQHGLRPRHDAPLFHAVMGPRRWASPGRPAEAFLRTANPRLGEEIACYLGVPPGQRTIARFADGETYVRFEENARSEDTFIVQPTCPPANEHLMKLLSDPEATRRAENIEQTPPPYQVQSRTRRGFQPASCLSVINHLRNLPV